jgi:ring-1,2-phenylacetyl-CoA epoxidase subunit PaaE
VPSHPVADRLWTLRRDLRFVAATLQGRTLTPVVRVSERRAAPAVVSPLAPRSMRVASVVRETADAVTLVLQPVDGAPVQFAPGQFFTLHVSLPDGEVARRAYSASSSPLDASSVGITVKRVAGGRVSTHLVERARPGDVLAVLGPSGSFGPGALRSSEGRRVVLVGGGSGITPLMSIARTLLATEMQTRVALVYANDERGGIVFHDALEELARRHPGRFVVRHVLVRPPEGWTGGVGRLDGERLAGELAALGEDPRDADGCFVCGPDPMMRAVRACLEAAGVTPGRIHEERFVSAHAPATPVTAAQSIVVRLGGIARRVVVPAGRTVLEAALDAGVPMPFSCTVGGCGACRVRVVDGELATDEPSCLSPEERAAGHVLACGARPRGPCTLEVA